jgi:hypothetical protein
MDGKVILTKIIQEGGNCCWSRPSICRDCPLGKLAKYDNGGYMSCIEALNIESLTEEEADKRYKEAALDILASMALEQAIMDS